MVRNGAAVVVAACVLTVAACTMGPPRPEPPEVPPIPRPNGAATLDCDDRAAVPASRESDDVDMVVAHVMFRGLAQSSVDPAPDILATDDPATYALFSKAPVHVPPGISWVVIELVGEGAATAWVPAAVWTGHSWVVDDHAAPSLVLDLGDCSSPGGLRDGSVFLGGLVAAGEGCFTLRVRTSVMPRGEERQLTLGSLTCTPG